MIDIRRFPDVNGNNGWMIDLEPREPPRPLKTNIRVDWVVVGAGYAGLSAARRLAQNCPNDRIAVVDAGLVGENASGRNSGFAIDLPHNITSSLDEFKES